MNNPMIFTDTHTHLYTEEFFSDREQVVQRAIDNGVKYLFVPNIDRSYYPKMTDLCSRHPENCFPMIGLHPTSVKSNWNEEVDFIREKLASGETKFYGIGEVGIDLYWDKTYAKEQAEVLKIEVGLALKYHLPLVIHTRNSFYEVVTVLEKKGGKGLSGVFHCFGGSLAQAWQAVELGFFLGIGGVVTYENSGLNTLIQRIGLEHILLETDSPWLTPVPYRGQRNESAYIPVIAEKIAQIKRIPVEEVARITTQNAKKLFNINAQD